MTGSSSRDTRGRRVPVWAQAAGAVALACLVATWATWPLVAHLRTQVARPGSGGILDVIGSSDVFLTHWILAWDTHALRTAPTRLLDANIFWPAPRTLALSEHMLGFLPLYLPLALASHDPVQSTTRANAASQAQTKVSSNVPWCANTGSCDASASGR